MLPCRFSLEAFGVCFDLDVSKLIFKWKSEQIYRYHSVFYVAYSEDISLQKSHDYSSESSESIGWMGEFDLNTLRVDGEIYESGKKKVADSKISR